MIDADSEPPFTRIITQKIKLQNPLTLVTGDEIVIESQFTFATDGELISVNVIKFMVM